jgi:hypothetical protein
LACKVTRDEHGALYRVPAFTPKERNSKLEARPYVDLWWDRDAKDKANEDIVIRQENGDRADTIIINFGQLYDLLHAAACLVKDI